MKTFQDPALELSLDNRTFQWLSSLVAIHLVSQALATKVGPFKSNPALLAHQVCAFVSVVSVGLGGAYYWYTQAGEATTGYERLYKPLSGGPIIAQINLAFQIYDLVTTFLIKDLRKIEMVVHHTLAVLLATFILKDGYSHYYTMFFLGMTEASAIPLCIVDVFKFFRHDTNLTTKYAGLNNACRGLFAAAFLSIRAVYWPILSCRYFVDAWASYKGGYCHSIPLATFFTVSNVALTLLQWYWASLIIKALVKMASGNDKKKDMPVSKTANGKAKPN